MAEQSNEEKYEELEQTFTLMENIDRIWFWVRDARLMILISNFDFEPFVITKGTNTFLKGNEFEGKIFNSLDYKCKVIECESQSFYKRIKWKCSYENKYNMFFAISLYKVSNQSKTVLLCQTDYTNELKGLFHEKNIPFIFTESCNVMIENVKRVLHDSAINLSQYESCIIRAQMDNIWDVLLDFKMVKNIAPLSCFDCEYHYDTIEEGCVMKIKSASNKSYLIRIVKIDKKEESTKWSFTYELIEGMPKVPCRETTVAVKKINKEECHLSIATEFNAPADCEFLQMISAQKKYILNSIKDYIENYK